MMQNEDYMEEGMINLQNLYDIKLGILDSRFPNLRTGFRIAEFNWYIKNLTEVNIFSGAVGFQKLYDEYRTLYPQYASNIHDMKDCHLKNKDIRCVRECDLLYFLFLSNTYCALTFVNHYKKPFVFTLYPGSGFVMNDYSNNLRLKAVFNSPYFRKVIVTQKVLKDYVLDNGLVSKSQVEFIYGVVTNPPIKFIEKKYYPSKSSFDICFVANKYMEQGLDKGYDTFIHVCKKLNKLDKTIKFHIVGGFNKGDMDVTDIKDSIHFYGARNPEFFTEFYSKMDIMISPTRPFVILAGAFDGFPTTCCVDAALNECFVFSADALNNNLLFEDHKHMCIINQDADDIASKVIYYKENPKELYTCAKLGKDKFNEIFNVSHQMHQRLKVFNDALGRC